jgi:hypothetical protein
MPGVQTVYLTSLDLLLQFPKLMFHSNAKWWDNASLNLKDCHLEQSLQDKTSSSVTSISSAKWVGFRSYLHHCQTWNDTLPF